MKELRSSYPFALILLTMALQVHPQQSEFDTLQIVESSGSAGDTVWVPVSLKNTFEVSGISIRIRFDPLILKVLRVDTTGTRVSGIYTRFPTQIDNDSGITIWNGLNFDDPFNNYVPPGTGPIAYVVFEIDKDAVSGNIPIHFENDTIGPGYYLNLLSDRWGNGIFPTLVDGWIQVTSTEIEDPILDGASFPLDFFLGKASPNPFSRCTSFRFGVPLLSQNFTISIKIFSLTGRLIKILESGSGRPGWHLLKWNGRDSSGRVVPGGIYFCRMEVNGECIGLRKVVFLK